MKQRYILRYCSAIVLISLLAGCSQAPTNLSDSKKIIERYYDSGKFDAELDGVIDLAKKYFNRIQPNEHSAVIFDIDDTVLSNYHDMKSIDFGYIPKLSHDWILQADAPVIPQSKELYDQLVAQGFHIIFLTGRQADEYEASLKNLQLRGFNQFDRVIVRGPEEKKLSAKDYKTAHRKALTEQGYTIEGSVGDQWSDLEGGYTGHVVKLPNYTYKID